MESFTPHHCSPDVLAVWFHPIMYKDCFHKKLNRRTVLSGQGLLSPVSDRNCRGVNARQPTPHNLHSPTPAPPSDAGTVARTHSSGWFSGFQEPWQPQLLPWRPQGTESGPQPQKSLSQNNLTPVPFHVNREGRAFSGRMRAELALAAGYSDAASV